MVNLENLSAKAEKEGIRQQFFEILTSDIFEPHDLHVSISQPGASFSDMPEHIRKDLDTIIENEWAKEIERMKENGQKPWPNDEKPSRYHLAGWKVHPGRPGGKKLSIELDPCISYKSFIGARSEAYKDYLRKLGPEDEKYRLTAVGVTTIILGRSAKNPEEQVMMLTRRNESHDYKPGGYHVSTGGYMEIKRDRSPLDTALREKKEESGITDTELKAMNIACVGIERNASESNVDIVFLAETELTDAEILSRKHDDENEVLFAPRNRRKLQEWLLAPAHAGVSSGLAAIIMAGKHSLSGELDNHGNPIDPDEWEKEMLKALAWRSRDYVEGVAPKSLEKRDASRVQKLRDAIRRALQ